MGDFRIDLRSVCIFLRCLISELNQGEEGLDGSRTVGINWSYIGKVDSLHRFLLHFTIIYAVSCLSIFIWHFWSI